MQKAKRPILINVIIVTTILLINFILVKNNPDSLGSGFFLSGMLIFLLAGVNLIVGMVRNRNRTGDGQYYLLIAGILLLIGIPVCSIAP